MDADKVAAPKGTTTGVGGSSDGSSSSSAHGRNTLRDELQKDGGLRIIQEIDEEPPSDGGSTGGGGSPGGGGGFAPAGRGGGRAPDDVPSMVTVTTVIFGAALTAIVLSMVTVTTVIFGAALTAIVLPLNFTNPIRRTMYHVLLVCVAAIVSASSRALTAFRRELVVGWVNRFHPVVATLLMAAVATFITTTWYGWLCLMVLFVNLDVVDALNHSGVIGDCVRHLRLWLGWKDNTAQLPRFSRSA
jgi:hypothetical protein